jgi:DUF1680 family protein
VREALEGSSVRPNVFQPLPLGSIRPTGWLLSQLQTQAAGLSGHLDEFWPDVAQSGWIGGEAEGWERGPYWLDGVVPLAFQLDDPRLIAKVTHWIDYILDHQREDGWLGPARDRQLTGDRKPVPGQSVYSHEWYAWPRFIVLKAMTQYFEVTGDDRIIPAMTRFLRCLDSVLDAQPLRSWARYRWADLVVSIFWLYEHTPEDWLLDLAAKARRQGFDWMFLFANYPFHWRTSGVERDLTTHVVNNAMGIKAAGVWYRQSEQEGDRDAVDRMIETLDRYHGQVTGVFSGDEHLAGRHPSQGTELCAVVEYMYSLEVLIAALGDAALADRLERIAFNALPATISPDMWSHQYVQQVNQVICKVEEDRIYTSNGPDANIFGLEPHFGCCTANMHQGWPKLVSHVWMRTRDGGLAAISFAPCNVATLVRDVPVGLRVETNYPFGETVRIRVSCDVPVSFSLHLRIPGWAQNAEVRVNDESGIPGIAGHYLILEREWQGGEVIDLHLPLEVRAVEREGQGTSLAAGALVLALPIREEWHQIGGELPHADWEIYPASVWNVAVDVDVANPGLSHSIDDASLTTSPFAGERAPVVAVVRGATVPEWGIAHNSAGPVPASPAPAGGSVQDWTLVPYGTTNLRIAEFPRLAPGDG